MKNSCVLLLGTVLAGAVFVSCDKDEYLPPDKNKYIYDIPQITLTESARVGAYYTNIATTYWRKDGAPQYTGTPVLGEYTSLTESVMEQHVEWADEAGLDYFVFGWNAGSTDDALLSLFASKRAADGVRMVVNFNTSHLGISNDQPLQSDEKLTQMRTEFTEKMLPLFQSDAYFRVGDRPVVLISPVNLSSAALNSIDYSQVLPALRDEMAAYGIDLYIIGEFTNGWTAPVNYPRNNLAPFDGITLKDWSTNDYDRRFGYFSFIDLNWQNWTRFLSPLGTDFVPCVFPSYDDKVYSPTSTDYTFGKGGSTEDYVTNCNLAKKNMGPQRLILLNSWNNFQKGTNLEPTTENKSAYLGVTRAQFIVE
ncbi:glycoside hydrolase family 99-like domain-containing protein [Gallalistipes aquisgranensis]|uniref:glycoside hydrolase family 99-like domain-containing protein n=1 Tax=Gallalistipes aquisgranensis TaxID=2779358 RepID=UPI001CF89D9C|nr:glycoside hydrolase family 99-like domain-containing protein [Gallalistipes aquisgranensis]MBE5034397.1 glycoside hydrolase family 99-like domain-containing protein [Gallalistipes aquisgranensis]